jgi:hypothetical protein
VQHRVNAYNTATASTNKIHDVLQLVGDRPVARTLHTAIYQPRGVPEP